jgi:hypothetical protein
MRIALGLLAAGFAVSVQGAACVAKSGPNTSALVELYTARSCSTCAAADRWLSTLVSRGHVPHRVVPLALYVGDLSLRQRKLTPLQRLALVYTPQVMLQGRDFRGWATPAFDEAVATINAVPARARLELQIVSTSADLILVRAAAEVLDARQIEHARLYLAAYENRPQSRVHVVLEWQGPLAFSRAWLAQERPLALLPGALAADSGVVGFVQNRRTAEVLQALMLPSCP